MIDTETTTCQYKHCGRPLVQSRRGPHKRQYCNDVCRQLAFRLRRKEQIREAQAAAMRARWSNFLPSTQQVLQDISQMHSEGLADRVAAAIADEVARVETSQDLEKRYRTDYQVRHFKSWLRKHPQAQDTDFAKRFIADTRLPEHASRGLYGAHLRLYKYSEKDMYLFQEAWKDMMVSQP